jgi:hypothetical protein
MHFRTYTEQELNSKFNAAFAAAQDAKNTMDCINQERMLRKDEKLARLELALEEKNANERKA